MGAKFSNHDEVLDLGGEVTKTISSKCTDGKEKASTDQEKSSEEMTVPEGSSRKFEEYKIMLNNLSILLVDDSITVVKTMKWDLERRGHYVKHARNGKIALDILIREQEVFDAILMDIDMPVMGGLEALWLLRQWEKSSVKGSQATRRRNFVVCMSATSVNHTSDMDAFFLAKPFPMTAFIDLIKLHFGVETEAFADGSLLGEGLIIDGAIGAERRPASAPPQLDKQVSGSENPVTSGRADLIKPIRSVNYIKDLIGDANKSSSKASSMRRAALTSCSNIAAIDSTFHDGLTSVPPASSNMASSKSGTVLSSAKMVLASVIGTPTKKKDPKKVTPLSPSSV